MPLAEGGWDVCGPTDQPYRPTSHKPSALDDAGIRRVIASYAASTARAERCGFDLLELHGSHGYLLHSFYSPLSNTRRDGYGGPADARMRLTLEVVEAVRAVWPAHKPLGFRISASDFIEGGLTVEDAVALGPELKRLGVDYIVPSVGLLNNDFKPPTVDPGYLVPFSERIRRDVAIPTMAVGMILKPSQANEIVEQGRADIAGMGRAFLNDPRWGWHAAVALGTVPNIPPPYRRVMPKAWPGYRQVCGDEAAAALDHRPLM